MSDRTNLNARKAGRPKDPDLEARRRTEILNAATKVFAADGYADADVQVVADALGVGKGTIYRYFSTKQELFLSAVDRGLDSLSAEMEAVIEDRTIDPIDQIRRAFHVYLSFFHARPELTELFIQERVAFRGRHTPRYFATKGSFQARDEAFLKELIAMSRLRDVPPEQLLTTIGDLLYGTVLSNHLSGRVSDPTQQANAMLDVLFHGILTDAERKSNRKKSRRS